MGLINFPQKIYYRNSVKVGREIDNSFVKKWLAMRWIYYKLANASENHKNDRRVSLTPLYTLAVTPV